MQERKIRIGVTLDRKTLDRLREEADLDSRPVSQYLNLMLIRNFASMDRKRKERALAKAQKQWRPYNKAGLATKTFIPSCSFWQQPAPWDGQKKTPSAQLPRGAVVLGGKRGRFLLLCGGSAARGESSLLSFLTRKRGIGPPGRFWFFCRRKRTYDYCQVNEFLV